MKTKDIEAWLGDVLQEKDNGAIVTEHDLDAIVGLLEDHLQEHKALQRIIDFRDELLGQPEGVARDVGSAFANEIDRALKGER